MKEDKVTRIQICPRCRKAYSEPAALSRVDNQTLVCPDCGTREALATLGISEAEQERILAAIHGCRRPE